MNEKIEIKDVDGKSVWVPLYSTIAACARAIDGASTIEVPLGNGEHAELRRLKARVF